MKITPASSGLAYSFWEALCVVALERKYLLMVESPAFERTLAFIKEIEDKSWTQFYALENDKVIGWCDIIPHEREGITHVGCLGMGVLPPYRRKGIGELLLKACIKDAFAKGIERIELEVYATNIGAIKLYEKLNFTREGDKRRARYLDGEYDDITIMSLLKTDQNKTGILTTEETPYP